MGKFFLFVVLLAASLVISAAQEIQEGGNTAGSGENKSGETVIRIHRKSMMLEFVENGEAVLGFPVRVGKRKTPTPLGEGVIYEKRSGAIFRYLEGPKKGKIIRYSTCEDGKTRKINYKEILALGIKIHGKEKYSIHSVTCPETVGRAISHGCIGARIDDMLTLYPRIAVGTKVVITDD